MTIKLDTYLLVINKTHKDIDKAELSQNSSTNIATQNFNNDIVDLLKRVEAISQTLSKHQEVLAQKPRTCKPAIDAVKLDIMPEGVLHDHILLAIKIEKMAYSTLYASW